MSKELEIKIIALGKAILEGSKKRELHILSPLGFVDKLLESSLNNAELKIALFRFVDVMPSLKNSKEIVSHLEEYFLEIAKKSNIIKLIIKLSKLPILREIVSTLAKTQINSISKKFILGESPTEALYKLAKLKTKNRKYTVDLLGEAALSGAESEEYFFRYKELIKILSANSQIKGDNEDSPVNISIKLSSLYESTNPLNFEQSVLKLSEKLSSLFRLVKESKGTAFVDMEDSSLVDITLAVVKNVLTKEEFSNYKKFGIVLQAYLKRTEKDLDNILDWIKNERKTQIQIRLVKGAYWDTEFMSSISNGWDCPVFIEKTHSDFNYEKLSYKLLNNTKYVYPAFASHNIRSLSNAICIASELKLEKHDFEIQTLYGMGEEFKDELVARGFSVREYAPVGKMLPGMAYLVRRLLENTANEGFLRRVSFDKISDLDELLKAPSIYNLAHDLESNNKEFNLVKNNGNNDNS